MKLWIILAALILSACPPAPGPPQPPPPAPPAPPPPPPPPPPGPVATVKVVRIGDVGEAYCFVDSNGQLSCWGENESLFGSTGVQPPTFFAKSHQFIGIAFTGDSICGLKADGTVWCQGDNSGGIKNDKFGALGVGDLTLKNIADMKQVITDQKFVQLVGSNFGYLGLTAQGKIYSWGDNANSSAHVGFLGIPDIEIVTQPTLVNTSTLFVRIFGLAAAFCALDQDSRAWCFGENQETDEGLSDVLGVGSQAEPVVLPTRVKGDLQFSELFAASGFICGVTLNDQTHCWGTNIFDSELGTLGTSDITSKLLAQPTRVQTSEIFKKGSGTCALTAFGEAWCWGVNFAGPEIGILAVGDTTKKVIPTPQKVTTSYRFDELATQGSNYCGIATGQNIVVCWGDNSTEGDELDALGTGDDSHQILTTPTIVLAPK